MSIRYLLCISAILYEVDALVVIGDGRFFVIYYGQAIIFLPCVFFPSSSILLFSSPNLSGRRLDVYHTSTHGVALVRI